MINFDLLITLICSFLLLVIFIILKVIKNKSLKRKKEAIDLIDVFTAFSASILIYSGIAAMIFAIWNKFPFNQDFIISQKLIIGGGGFAFVGLGIWTIYSAIKKIKNLK